MENYSDVSEPKKPIGMRAYGISGSTLRKEIESITGVNPGNNAVYSKETGRVSVESEVFGAGSCGGGGDCYCGKAPGAGVVPEDTGHAHIAHASPVGARLRAQDVQIGDRRVIALD